MTATRIRIQTSMHWYILLLLGVSSAQLFALLVKQAGAFSPPPPTSCLPSASTAGTSTRAQQAKSASWASLLSPAKVYPGYYQPAVPFDSISARYATTATAPPPAPESEQQQQQQASPSKEKVEALPRLGRVKAMSLLQSLVDDLRHQQGGDGSHLSSTSSSCSSSISPSSTFPSSALDEEVEPFYALAQQCRQSDLPDIVLEVLNSYRAMASPGALSIGAPRTADFWTLIITAHAALGDLPPSPLPAPTVPVLASRPCKRWKRL